MLISLLVKNIAIINEIEVNFKEHLNILTGETGAGKSIIIDSINIALGGKVSKDIIRRGQDYALVELVFETKDEKVLSFIEGLGIDVEEGQIIISRKINANRSICRLNGETVTMAILSQIGNLLIDIHGQHDNQSLLNKSSHLEFVDRYAKGQIGDIKEILEKKYKAYIQIKNEYHEALLNEDQRLRELSFMEYELNEINEAMLVDGEDIELEENYKRLSNSSTIMENLQNIYDSTGYSSSDSAADIIGRSIKLLSKISLFDPEIQDFYNQLSDIEDLLNGFNMNISTYLSEMDNNEELLDTTSKRLDLINHLKSKYGNTIPEIKNYANSLSEKLDKYRDYSSYLEKLKIRLDDMEKEIDTLSERLSTIRQKQAKELTLKIRKELVELNFLDVKFEMVFSRLGNYTSNGYDEAEFIISTNIGEPLKSLSKVASGGELSRIMLGIKSVLADKDDIETLIFDEIDTGISGRTAQKVSEQLSIIAKHHQIICITHLAQIAAMADTHYIIEKLAETGSTHTYIRELNDEQSIDELSRIIGGVEITDRIKESAIEMKQLATRLKK